MVVPFFGVFPFFSRGQEPVGKAKQGTVVHDLGIGARKAPKALICQVFT